MTDQPCFICGTARALCRCIPEAGEYHCHKCKKDGRCLKILKHKNHEAVCIVMDGEHGGMVGTVTHETGKGAQACCRRHSTGLQWTEIVDLSRWSAEHHQSQLEYINMVFDQREELSKENARLKQENAQLWKCIRGDHGETAISGEEGREFCTSCAMEVP